MISLEKLGVGKESPSEIVITTFNPDGSPHASTMGVKASGKSKVSLKVFTDTVTYRNLSSSRAAVVNIVKDVELIAGLALRDILNFDDSVLKFKSSKLVNAPRLENADAFLEIEVESLRRRRILDELGESEAAYFVAGVKCIDLQKPCARALRRSESLAIESAVLATKIVVAMKNGKQKNAKHLFLEIAKHKERCALIGSKQDSHLITSIVESLRRRFGWRG